MPSLDTLMSYHRLKKAPLDDSEIFNNLRDLMDYCENGASYDGQRVAVLNGNLGLVEYAIKNNIPMIDMKGSEPIFKTITFKEDSSASHGMLVYEYNSGGSFSINDVFCFEYDKFCIINQLEIFRILDAGGNKTFKFYIERLNKNTGEVYTAYWNQNYNPFIDGESNTVNQSNGAVITKMSFYKNDNDSFIKTNNSAIKLMPKNIGNESNYNTKIYVKAEDYYQAWK